MAEQGAHGAAIGQAQHVANGICRDRLAAVGDGLIKDRQPVAHAALGGAGNQRQRVGFKLHLLLFEDAGEMVGQHLGRHALQIEPLATRQDRGRHLVHLGGGHDELHARRRFFQRFQQRVERRLRQHVDFVDDVDLVTGRYGGIAHALDDLAHIINAGVGRGVHFHNVHMAAGRDGNAGLAHPARVDRRAAVAIRPDAVQCFRNDARSGGLAHPAHAGQQPGLRQSATRNGVAQRLHHRRLPEQRIKCRRAIFACQHTVSWCGHCGRQFKARKGDIGFV